MLNVLLVGELQKISSNEKDDDQYNPQSFRSFYPNSGELGFQFRVAPLIEFSDSTFRVP